MSNANLHTVVLDAKNISKTYRTGPDDIVVWENVDLQVYVGETISIIGASGSGKSTLLNALGGLDSIDGGEVTLAGHKIHSLAEIARTQLRNRDLGFVYQFHHLLNDFPAIYNVALPLLIMGSDKNEALLKSKKILTKVGLENRLNHKPSELSGGERQRVAIARAMITEPACLLADEPTGNLDAANAAEVLELIIELNKNKTTALLIVTHDLSIANKMGRKLSLSNSEIHET